MKRSGAISLLTLLVAGCGNADVFTFLGCSWNVDGLTRRNDGSYVLIDVDPPVENFFTVYFHDRPFDGLGSAFDFIEENPTGQGVVTRRFRTNDETPSPGLDVYVIEREGFDHHVRVIDHDYRHLLLSCE